MIKNCSHFKILSGKFAKKYQYRCICDRKYKNRTERVEKWIEMGKREFETHFSTTERRVEKQHKKGGFALCFLQ